MLYPTSLKRGSTVKGEFELRDQEMYFVVSVFYIIIYCKSGNIRGTLIFAYFAQIQQARIQKPAMHILDT